MSGLRWRKATRRLGAPPRRVRQRLTQRKWQLRRLAIIEWTGLKPVAQTQGDLND